MKKIVGSLVIAAVLIFAAGTPIAIIGWSSQTLADPPRNTKSPTVKTPIPELKRPQESAGSLVSLYTWYNSTSRDHFSTTAPEWAGAVGETRLVGDGDGYKMIRVEGSLHSPEEPRPPNTVPLFNWFSNTHKDNFITSNSEWAGSPGDVRAVGGGSGYRMVRLEGYVSTVPSAGTKALQHFYSRDTTDNYSTTDPRWHGRPGDEWSTGHKMIRNEGYLYPPFTSVNDSQLSQFGHRRLLTVGQKPLLVILQQWADLTFQNHTRSNYISLFSSGSATNFVNYTEQSSGGRFRWEPIRIIGPVTATSKTWAQANSLPGSENRRIAVQLAGAAGVDYSSFDKNGDRQVTSDELSIIRFTSTPTPGTGGQSGPPTPQRLNGVRVVADVALLNEASSLSTIMHELLHQFGAVDTYGPNFGLNFRLSAMSTSLAPDDNRGILPDPWHRMQLGWLTPEVYSINDSGALPGHSLELGKASQSITVQGRPKAFILADPINRPNEFFILEYRNPNPNMPTNYDRGVNSQGVAIWHILSNNTKSVRVIQRTDDRANLIAWPRGLDTTQQVPGILSVGAPNRQLGVANLWNSSHGLIALRWFDGSDTRARIRVGVTSPTSSMVGVEWYTLSNPFLPRIDNVRLSHTGAAVNAYPSNLNEPYVYSGSSTRASSITLFGEFGVGSANREIYLIRKSYKYRLTVRQWSLRQVSLSVPSRIPPGKYRIGVFNGRYSNAGSSNTIVISVRSS